MPSSPSAHWSSASAGATAARSPAHFPFYIGIIVVLASAATLVEAIRESGSSTARRRFLDATQAMRILAFFGPMAGFVVARRGRSASTSRSIVYLTATMMVQGRYRLWRALAVSVGSALSSSTCLRGLVQGAAAQGPARSRCCGFIDPVRRVTARRNAGSEDSVLDNFGNLLDGFRIAASGYHVALMMAGVLLGILVGVLPGLGAPNGVSLLLPLTFTMDPVSAIILLTSMYWGALFGGSTTSILFNIPGEPSSVATTFDGYPMAQQGRATRGAVARLPVGRLRRAGRRRRHHAACPAGWRSSRCKFRSPEYFAVYFLGLRELRRAGRHARRSRPWSR